MNDDDDTVSLTFVDVTVEHNYNDSVAADDVTSASVDLERNTEEMHMIRGASPPDRDAACSVRMCCRTRCCRCMNSCKAAVAREVLLVKDADFLKIRDWRTTKVQL